MKLENIQFEERGRLVEMQISELLSTVGDLSVVYKKEVDIIIICRL